MAQVAQELKVVQEVKVLVGLMVVLQIMQVAILQVVHLEQHLQGEVVDQVLVLVQEELQEEAIQVVNLVGLVIVALLVAQLGVQEEMVVQEVLEVQEELVVLVED